MRMSDLASSVLLSASGVTRLVDQLADRGLIERQADSKDARATIAVLTREGKALLRKTNGIYSEGVIKHFASHLADAEVQAIAEALEGMLARGEEPVRPRERRRRPG